MRRFQGESIVFQSRWLISSSGGAALTAALWHHAAVGNQGHLQSEEKHGCTVNQIHGAAFIFFPLLDEVRCVLSFWLHLQFVEIEK